MSFPTLAEELALHERVLRRESVASVDVFRVFMDPIVAALNRKRGRPPDDVYDSVIDVLVSYLRNPERFIAQKGRLSTYLTQAAKKRVQDRHRSAEARRRREQEFGGAFELRTMSPKEALEIHVEARLAVGRLEHSKLPERDRALLKLVLQGERSTRVMAKAIGMDSLPEDDLKREVKRHRDRLMKRLARFGKESSDVDP
jgi:RNA polymerase sigma-70 factor (ECF subfamily)